MAPQPSDQDYLEKKSRAYALVVVVERLVAMCLLLALLILVVMQVFMRFVLHAPLVWTEEVARYVLIWLTFTAAVFVMARRQHIAVELFSARGSGRVVAALDALAYTVVLIVSVSLTVGGVQLMLAYAHVRSTTAGIPMSVVYAALTVGMALMAVHAIFNIYLSLRYPTPYKGTEEIEKGGVDA